MRASLLLSCLLLGGCAWEPGEGFAEVEPTLRAAYTPLAAREAGEGYQRLSSDFQVRVEGASLRLSGVELLGGSGGGGGGFDPANPPPGYSLCHGGHCHRDDGALIPYEQIAAELGGGGGLRTLVTLPVQEPLDLLAPEARAMDCEPSCALPRTEVSRGRWPVRALRLEGTVRDARSPPRFPGERRFRLELAAADTEDKPVAVLDGELELPSDRAHPPRVRLDLRLELTAALFDPVDWGTAYVGPDGVVLSRSENEGALAVLLERLARFAPEAEVTREER